MHRLNPNFLSAIALLLGACSVFEPPIVDQTQNDGGETEDAAMDSSMMEDGGGDSGPPSCVVPSIVTVNDCTGNIVINEVDGSGEDFIELYNRGTTPVNISGYVITDGTDDTPSVAEGVVVPDGTVLDPGRFIYVWANLDAPQPGIRTADCMPNSPPPCLHSNWGINAGGEMTYLLDDTLTVVCKFRYPSAVFGGESFGRYVDGTEMLCPTDPTPGEVNVPSTAR